jgi:hypothetical protein
MPVPFNRAAGGVLLEAGGEPLDADRPGPVSGATQPWSVQERGCHIKMSASLIRADILIWRPASLGPAQPACDQATVTKVPMGSVPQMPSAVHAGSSTQPRLCG